MTFSSRSEATASLFCVNIMLLNSLFRYLTETNDYNLVRIAVTFGFLWIQYPYADALFQVTKGRRP
jgi:hypothetical protein